MAGVSGKRRILEIHRSLRILQADIDTVLIATRAWLDKAVVGLQLCPFAAPVLRSGTLRLQVSEAQTSGGLLEDLRLELQLLSAAEAAEHETTLLIHPLVLGDFYDFNEFLAEAERALLEMDFEGVFQIASFHPRYQFAGTAADEMGNYTNRSPYPMLHILREASLTRALEGLAEPDEIYRANIRTLQALGSEGWAKLWRE